MSAQAKAAPPASDPRFQPAERTTEDCLHRMVEAQAARTPEAAAVIFEGGCLSYGALNRRANRLARFLRARGVGPEVIVGVCAGSGSEMIVALLAVLKAGGAYLPLDPAYPPERLAFLIEDAGTALVLASSRFRAALPAACQVVSLGAGLEDGEPSGDLADGAAPDGLAYVIYTSGSTGQPKGVLLAHRGACINLRWRQECFPLTSADRMLQSYSFSFDPSVWAIFWPLVSGATLVLPRPAGITDSAYVVKTLAEQQITVAGFGPAQLQTLLAHPDIGSCSSLRHLFCGGEVMPTDLPRLVHARLGAALHNVYGPTEATIDAAYWTVPRGYKGESIPIGYPAAEAELLLLGDDLRPVPEGEPGELYIAGAGLARGYLNRPELTAERFLPHPFSQSPGARLYRTGDQARRGTDGEVYYLGRVDTQVKLRGFRIELGEIEAALRARPDVLDAVVLLREDQPGEKRLAAYVVPVAGTAPSGPDLRRSLALTLPAHMVPAAVVFLPEFPRSPSGKRDRNALPPPEGETWERGPDFVPPQDPLQHQLTQIWEDLLDLRPIGIRDSFWDLGGHSLLAARLLDQIAHACGRSVPLSALYEGGTVETLAAFLRRSESLVPTMPLAKLAKISGGARRPFFYLYGFHPLGGFYCYHLARRLHGEQPLLLLHPPTERGPEPLTVEGMAADYLSALRAAQPHGPYRLGGFCGSGLVAYEMARQLTAQGETVEFLALIEAHAINAPFRLALRRLSRRPGRFRAWQRAVLPVLAAVQSRWRVLRGRGEPGLLEACDRAAAAYVPLPYAGPVRLLRAADDPESSADAPLGLWREVAPVLIVEDVPGTHLSCLLEHVGALGEHLGAGLDALDAH